MKRLGLTLLALTLFAGCTRRSNDNGKKVLRLYFLDDVKSLDPVQANDQPSAEVLGHLFEGLVQYSYLGAPDSVIPAIAEALPTFANKGRLVTFKLRDGVTFQDDAAFPGGKGRALLASDFVYVLKRIADPRTGSSNWWMFEGVIEGLDEWRAKIESATGGDRDKLFDADVAGLSAPDARTFVLKLKKSYPQLLQILAMPTAVAMAREVVEKYGPEIINHPVGTGPFRLKSWVRSSKVAVEKNPTFHGETYPSTGSEDDRSKGLLAAAGAKLPFVDEIQWDIIKEEQPRWLKFKKGELDLAEIPKDNFLEAIDGRGELKEELASQGVRLHKYLSLTSWWIEFNLKDPVLGKNKKLRQAISAAFDRSRALDILFSNRGILADAPLPVTVEGGSDVAKFAYGYDLVKAKSLLAEAGFPDGKGLPELTFDLRGPGTTHRQMGELLKDNLGKVGIRLNILANSFPEALEKAKRSRFQMMLGGWAADYPDSENFMQLFYSGNKAPGTNTSNFANAEFDALYTQIRTQLPGPDRKKAVLKMVTILQEEVPGAYFYHEMKYRFSWKRLKNYKPHLFLYSFGKYLDVE